MTPQQLRNSILQFAIEGKLVEQRTEEGSGEELYQLIQEQKKELIEAGKLKKTKALSEITETEIPFEIPTTWKWVRWGDIIEIISSKRVHQSDWKKSGIPFYRAREISKLSEQGYVDNELFIDDALYRILSKYGAPNEGDLMISAVGTLGKTYIVKKTDKFYYKDASVLCLRNYAKLNSLFLKYIMESLLMKNQIKGNSSGTTVSTLTIVRMSNYIIPLPPLGEQNRIVKKIENLLLLSERYAVAWNKLESLNRKFPEDLQKSILQEAIKGNLCRQKDEDESANSLIEKILLEREGLIEAGQIKKQKALPPIQEDEVPFDIPATWEWVRIGDLVELNPKNELEDDVEAAFIPMACIMDGYKNKHLQETRYWKEIKKGFTHFADNDIAIAKITPCFQNRKSVIFKNLKSGFGAGTTEISVIRVIKNLLINEYLLWFFKSEYFIFNGVKSFTGTAGQQRIHKDYLSQCLIPIPPISEQKHIVEKIKKIFQLIEREKNILFRHQVE